MEMDAEQFLADIDKYSKTRRLLSEQLFQVLFESEDIKQLILTGSRTGPLGGQSAQITGFYKTDGDYYGFSINIYSDERVEEPLIKRMTESTKRRSITNYLESNGDSILLNGGDND